MSGDITETTCRALHQPRDDMRWWCTRLPGHAGDHVWAHPGCGPSFPTRDDDGEITLPPGFNLIHSEWPTAPVRWAQ